LKWLQHLTTEASPLAPQDRLVFREYHALLLYKLQRRDELDRQIERLAELPTLAPVVGRLQCFRGISLHSAMVLATEIVDWRRFERPAQLACHLGLVSREDSSGDRQRLGSITKAVNSHCRHLLVQAAWSYRHRPQTSVRSRAARTAPAAGGDHPCLASAAATAISPIASDPRSPSSPSSPLRVSSSAFSGP
jgi:transposase